VGSLVTDADGGVLYVADTSGAPKAVAMQADLDALEASVTAESVMLTRETAGAGGKLELLEATANGTSKVTLQAPAALGANRTITVPDADVDLADAAQGVADAATAQAAVDAVEAQVGITVLANLTTTDQTGLQPAINEVDANADAAQADATQALADAATAQAAVDAIELLVDQNVTSGAAPVLAVTNMTGSAAGIDSDATAHAASDGSGHADVAATRRPWATWSSARPRSRTATPLSPSPSPAALRTRTTPW